MCDSQLPSSVEGHDRVFISDLSSAEALEEESVYNLLADARFFSFGRTRRTGQLLFKTVLEKALFSSPAACLATVRQRLKKIEDDAGPDADKDRITLQSIAGALERIGPANFTNDQHLLDTLRPGGFLHWDPADAADRVVIFAERIETLGFLEQNLSRDLKLKPDQIAVVHARVRLQPG